MLLSICIPTFNRARFLTQSLTSIVSQIGDDGVIEVIVSDNASTDDTLPVVSSFCQKYPYVQYFRNGINIGAENNIFEVVKRAKGEWVWVFGDDDLLTDNGLSKVLTQIQRGEFDFIMTNKMVTNSTLMQVLIRNQNPNSKDMVFSDITDLCAEFGFFTQLGFITTAIFKREPFLKVDALPYRSLNMLYAYSAVFLEAFHLKPCLYMADVIVLQRQWEGSEVSQKFGYVAGSGILGVLKILEERGIVDSSFPRRVKENLLGWMPCTLAKVISEKVEGYE